MDVLGPDLDPLPGSARLALWFSAWVRGRASLDDARDAVVAGDAAHDVVGLGDEPVPLIVALGLGGPAPFNAEALEAGQAVVLTGADLGLVPVRAGAGVVWRCLPATSHRQVPDLPEADTGLRAALPAAADALAALDVARWRPEVADELLSLRRTSDLPVPPGTDPRAQRVLALAARCRRIVALALRDDGGAVTAGEADRRRGALLPLDRAARRALVAACQPADDRR